MLDDMGKERERDVKVGEKRMDGVETYKIRERP